MEGIAGIVYPDVFQMGDLIHPMFESMKHRCKNSQDVHVYKNIQIGLCGGKFGANEKRTILAGIDGFISNGEDLRKELTNQGFHFNSKNDNEILVNGYEQWGTELFQHLIGEFSVIIFDQRKNKILLARDRIGKKPLYWFHNQRYFIFASELKALLATGAVPQTPALDGLSSYLYFGFIPQDMSPIEGVNKLLPAHYIQLNFDGSKSITSYWSYSSYFLENDTRPKETVIKELDTLIKQGVSTALPKTDNIGCFLSGGLGSASIAYYLSTFVPGQQITAFTAGFAGENDEDVRAAKGVAKALNLRHVSHSITASTFLDDLVTILWHLDEPLADPNIIATWSLVNLISKDTKVVFSGMGSDELFAGHSRYSLQEHRGEYYRDKLLEPLYWLQGALIPFVKLINKPLAFRLMQRGRTYPWQRDYLQHNALMSETEIAEASPKLSRVFNPEIFLSKFHHLHRVQSKVGSYLYFDVKTRLVDCYMLQFERITAAHSLSWRVPFLDKKIVELLAKLPEPEYLEESETAAYLKAVVKGVFPESFIQRPKRTRKSFLSTWMEAPQMRKIFELLMKGTLVETGFISRDWLREKINGLGSNHFAYRSLWSVLILELWFRLYINRSINQPPHGMTVEQLLTETS